MLSILANVLVYIIPVAIIVVLLAITFVLIKLSKSKGTKTKIDSEFINNLVNILGGTNNVLSVTNDNGRIKFELEDLEKANLNGLKELSQSGVFVTNNTIKTLFPHDAKTISNAIKQLKD